MDRRTFFQRAAGAIAAALVAHKALEAAALEAADIGRSWDKTVPAYTHNEYGYSFEVTPEMLGLNPIPRKTGRKPKRSKRRRR